MSVTDTLVELTVALDQAVRLGRGVGLRGFPSVDNLFDPTTSRGVPEPRPSERSARGVERDT